MTLSLCFWVVYIVCLVFCGWSWRDPANRAWFPSGLVFFILIGLLGWQVFGPALHR